MDCVNHSGVAATAYCQTCGKALCTNCVRTGPAGQVFCEPDWIAWQSYQRPFVPAAAPGAPNPSAAAVLGLIPGVGAMYNGQFFKGLIHVVIFAVLVSISDHYGIFGIFIAAWVLYQSFEAYHTAKARRDGEPLPDPLGLNELGSWLNIGGRQSTWNQPGSMPNSMPGSMPSQGPFPGQGPMNPGPMNPGPFSAGPVNPGANPTSTGWQQTHPGQYQAPYSAPYAPPAAGFVDPGVPPIPPMPPIPPIPPVPPMYWGRKEPIGAIVLIALGLLFLLGQLDVFRGRLFEFSWPLLLIGLGVWLVIRRTQGMRGGSK
jgi:hypothetical protein